MSQQVAPEEDLPTGALALSSRILGLLRLRHPSDRGEWATFDEFTPGTGSGRLSGRRWDLLAVCCWGGNQGIRVVYEVKVDRADFARELADPSKRRFAEELGHSCWLAAAPGVVRDPAEAPEGWGLLELTKGGLVVRRHAAQRSPTTPDAFVAALARRASGWAGLRGERERAIPKAIWLLSGERVDEDGLVAFCERVLGRTVEAAVEAKRRADGRRIDEAEGVLRLVRESLGLHPEATHWDIRSALARRRDGSGVREADVVAFAARVRGLAREAERVAVHADHLVEEARREAHADTKDQEVGP